ncbi:alpha/beta fold hydrolase [Streptosporangium sp. CA-115845]|uniref:alpha/beta fold hydrolase n=1 Tax=Streptosporangium sp. CA-115845 TaxID=3240071 RepID=UPI003D905091
MPRTTTGQREAGIPPDRPRPFAVRRGPVIIRGDVLPPPPGTPSVLLIPGGGQTRASWGRTAHSLATSGLGALTVDLRGHGDSDQAPDADYGIDTLVGDLLAVCAALKEPPVVVGASLGGLIALLAVGEHPGCARALVMVDIAIDIQPSGVERVRTFMTDGRSGFDTLDEFAHAVSRYTGTPPAPAERMRRHTRRGTDGRWYWHWDPTFIDNMPDFLGSRDRLIAAARAVTVPALLVRGQRSDVVSADDLAALGALLPHAERLDVTGVGHMVTSDDNGVFTDGLATFVRSLEPKPNMSD